MTPPSRDTRVSARPDRPVRGNAAVLAEVQAFLEASIVSRPDLDRAAELADKCSARGEILAGDALERLVEKASDSNPEALEAAAAALNAVEGIRCAGRPQPSIPTGLSSLGRVGFVEWPAGEVTQLFSRLAALTAQAQADPAAFVAWARTVLSTASRNRRAEIVWALPSAGSADATRLILATPGLGRCTPDALVRLPEAEAVLAEFVAGSLQSPALLETEVDAILAAASALVRLGHDQIALDIAEASNPDLAGVGRCITSRGIEGASDSGLAMGTSAILNFHASSDGGALDDWLFASAPAEVLRVGRIVAGWPAGEAAGTLALDRWLSGECLPAVGALITGVEPAGAASALIERGRHQDHVLTGLLTSLASRIAILSDGGHLDAGEAEKAPLDPAMAHFSASAISPAASPLGDGETLSADTGIHKLAEMAANGSLAATEAIAASPDPMARRYEELLLTSVFPHVAVKAAAAVASRGSAGARYASHLLDSGDPSLLEAGFHILAKSSLEDARDDLLDALGSNDPWLLRAAASAAGEAAAATEDREISRALINAMTRIAGGSLTVVPEIAAIGNSRAIDQIVRLNERGQLFDSGRDDQLLAELLASGDEAKQAAVRRAEREREILHERWRAEGRLDDFGSGRLNRLADRIRKRGGRAE